jgi:hypothetical protein
MSDATFKNSTATARCLGVPEAWLRREAQAGRLSALRAGGRLLFNVELVRRELLERAAYAGAEGGER